MPINCFNHLKPASADAPNVAPLSASAVNHGNVPRSALHTVAVRIAIVCIAALVVWPAWVRGGTRPALQWPFIWIGLGALLSGGFALPSWTNSVRKPACLQWFRDPFFYVGLAFLGLLGLQWHYAGRFMFFDPIDKAWTYSPPIRPGWPFAFTRPEAAEMLRWFFPAWAIGLVLRSGIFDRREIMKLFRFLAVNAATIALLGLIQQSLSVSVFPYTAELRDEGVRFFAGFGYENHAASFFALASAISFGLLVRDIHRGVSCGRCGLGRIAFGGVVLTLNLAATQMSLSRAGILLGWILLTIAIGWLVAMAWQCFSPAKRLNAVVGGLGALLALAMLIYGFGHVSLRNELESVLGADADTFAGQVVRTTTGDRIQLARAAYQIWREHPWFGVGGWGYRYLLPYAETDDGWQWTQRYGKANVHNDPLQFLVEFGLAGAALLAVGLALLINPIIGTHRKCWRRLSLSPMLFFPLLGFLLVCLHSLIDLPFRSPAILFSAVITLSGAGCFSLMCNRGGPVQCPPGLQNSMSFADRKSFS